MEFALQPSSLRKSIVHAGWRLEYAAVDAGPGTERRSRAAIALHGFARPLEDLLALQGCWPNSVRLIAVHLPHHGASGPVAPELQSDAAISPATFIGAFRQIAESEGCDPDDLDLIGYSIGGRIALSVFTAAPANWARVVLLAPDGLKKAAFYDVTVHTLLGKWLWQGLDRHAPRINASLERLQRWGLVPKHLIQFALFHTSTAAMRDMVWHGWRAHRRCWPSTRAVARALKSAPTAKVDLCFGSKDLVIPEGNNRRLRRRTMGLPNVRFHRVLSGHGMLREEVLNQLIRAIFGT